MRLDLFFIRCAAERDLGAEPVFLVVGNRIGTHRSDLIEYRCSFQKQASDTKWGDLQFTGGKYDQDLIHGQDGKMARNTRKQNSTRGLDKISENQPQSALSELERRVIQLEKDVDILKQLTRWPVFNKDARTEKDKKTKPGVKERIEDEVLFTYRDGLTLWLEAYWPWMEDRLCRAGSAEEVGAILEAVSEQPDLRRVWQKRLIPNPAALFDFISDERFRKTKLPRATVKDALTLPVDDERRRRAANQFPARQIANAMAGVPDIGWRRSLDRCSANPSTKYIVLNTELYYRELHGLPLPDARELIGAYSPVPKPLQPVLAGPNK